MKTSHGHWIAAAGVAVAVVTTSGCAQSDDSDPATPYPLIATGQTQKLSDHAYAILDDNVSFVPNVGIVVGDRATLIIDTGVGTRNGEIILEEARKLSSNERFYVASTHYHTEHELGAGAFPDSAQIIRSHANQQDVDDFGQTHFDRFSGMSANLNELLQGSEFREADILFDNEYVLYLGGVNVRMMHVGPAHTRGDTVFFVEGEGVLFAGDVAMDNFPGIRTGDYSLAAWRNALARLARLEPEVVVPSHGPLGDGSLIGRYDELFATLQTRAAALKREGRTADEAAETIVAELGPSYTDWGAEDLPLLGNAARVAFAQAP